jgi:hypothetical protein
MADLSARRHIRILGAFAAAGATVIIGMIISTVGEAIIRQDSGILDLIPTVAAGGLVLGLIPLSLSIVAFLVAKTFHLVNATTAVIVGCLFGAVFGWLIGNPPLRVWSGVLVGMAAALVWWRLYARVTSSPRNTR